MRPWLKDGRKLYAGGKPTYCDSCPCAADTNCQCVFHYWGIWCDSYAGGEGGDPPPVAGHWLHRDNVGDCTLQGVRLDAMEWISDYIFYFPDATDPEVSGDGCFDLGGEAESWTGWELSGGLASCPGCAAGPNTTQVYNNVYTPGVVGGGCAPCSTPPEFGDCASVRPGDAAVLAAIATAGAPNFDPEP